jgi:16S rRNA processing protein RimM
MNRRRIKPVNRPPSPTGSPTPGEPVFVQVGQLRRPHGLKGEILMEIMTDFPERLKTGKTVFIGDDHQAYQITHRRLVAKGLLLTFSGFLDSIQVAVLTNKPVFVPANALPPLPEGSYYHHQLIGLSVVDEIGTALGKISEIIETGSNDVYVALSADGDELLLPALPDVILEINLEQGTMLVRPPQWA